MSAPRRVLVAGASGFVGRHLVSRLRTEGWPLRLGTRVPDLRRRDTPWLPWVPLDVDRPDTLDPALEGVDTLVYLVHHLHAHGPELVAREASAATRLARAAERHGVRRIVYLGAPAPAHHPSPHLLARARTGEALRASRVSTLELRAAMILGAGSQSWDLLRDLALRLPVLAAPAWLGARTAPIGIDDVVQGIALAMDHPARGSGAYDLPGPEVVTAAELVRRVAALSGRTLVRVPLPLVPVWAGGHGAALLSGVDPALARSLVAGLGCDLEPAGDGWWGLFPDADRTALDDALRAAMVAPRATPGAFGRAWERAVRGVGATRVSRRAAGGR
ncbi:MAG: NAD(P)H-binding protein [Alphaproteobacteria bacterium]|nr:NAD(P)H-binding protein [Alphaproteobacteria bacterium]